MPGITVAGTLSRKTKITAITAAIVMMSVISTSCTDARMFCVRSTTVLTVTDGGIAARRRGIAALMRSTVSITLAPASLRTNSMIERPLVGAACALLAAPA